MSISIKDLAVGNIIATVAHPHKHYEVLDIMQKCVNVKVVNGDGGQFNFRYEEIVGIPLKPLLLVDCGFVISNDSFGGWLYLLSADESIRIVNHKGIGYHFLLFGNTPVLTPFLHQLQNLIKSITGKDLIINH